MHQFNSCIYYYEKCFWKSLFVLVQFQLLRKINNICFENQFLKKKLKYLQQTIYFAFMKKYETYEQSCDILLYLILDVQLYIIEPVHKRPLIEKAVYVTP